MEGLAGNLTGLNSGDRLSFRLSPSLSSTTSLEEYDCEGFEGGGSPSPSSSREDNATVRIERQLEQYTRSLERALQYSNSDLSNKKRGPTIGQVEHDEVDDLLIHQLNKGEDKDNYDDDDDLESELIDLKKSRDTLRIELMNAKDAARRELARNLTTVPLDVQNQVDNESNNDDSDNDDIQDKRVKISLNEEDLGQVAYLDKAFYRKHHQELQQKRPNQDEEEEYEQDQLPSVEEYKADRRYRPKFRFLPNLSNRIPQGLRVSRRPDPPEFLKRKWEPVALSTTRTAREDQVEAHQEVDDDDDLEHHHPMDAPTEQHEKLILSPETSLSVQQPSNMELVDGPDSYDVSVYPVNHEGKLAHAWRLFRVPLCCCIFLITLITTVLELFRVNAQVNNEGSSRLRDVQFFLAEGGYSNLDVLQTPNTPQNRAAKWIADMDPQQLQFSNSKGPTTHASFLYRYALVVLYFAFGGDPDNSAWTSNLNFLSADHICEWVLPRANDLGEEILMGVHECIQEADDLIPVGLNFPLHGLQGTIPDEIQLLDRLETLILQYNAGIGGSLPSTMSTLSHLKLLSVHHCSLSYVVPDWIGNLEQLNFLGLGSNRLTGAIPSSIQALTNLKALGLDNNMLSGELDILGPLTDLRYLYLDNNKIQGSLTSSLLSGWKEMVELDVSENYLSGTLPYGVFSHEHLRVLDLHSNRLTGGIPEVTTPQGQARHALEFLALHENELELVIPKSIGLLQELRHLDLSMNRLSDRLPSTIGALTKLEYLFAGQNRLSKGPIPAFLEQLTNLRELSLAQSELTGTFPDFLGYKLTSLTTLDFSRNDIDGRLPESIGFLSTLDHLLLNRNELTGSLPGSFMKLSKLSFLLLDYNGFSGSANIVCGTNDEQLEYFASDCGGSQPEIECSCCTLCCHDGDQTCNDIDFYGNLDPTWESKYERSKYEFGLGIMPMP